MAGYTSQSGVNGFPATYPIALEAGIFNAIRDLLSQGPVQELLTDRTFNGAMFALGPLGQEANMARSFRVGGQMSEMESGIGGAVSKSRPSFRAGMAERMYETAEVGPNGGRICPTCSKEVFWESGQDRSLLWHIDHQPKWATRPLDGLTRPEIIDNYHEGIRFRCAQCNVRDN